MRRLVRRRRQREEERAPVPLGLSVRVSPTCLNFSKTLSWAAGAIPIPESFTLTSMFEPTSEAPTVTVPSGVNFTAFAIRLVTT